MTQPSPASSLVRDDVVVAETRLTWILFPLVAAALFLGWYGLHPDTPIREASFAELGAIILVIVLATIAHELLHAAVCALGHTPFTLGWSWRPYPYAWCEPRIGSVFTVGTFRLLLLLPLIFTLAVGSAVIVFSEQWWWTLVVAQAIVGCVGDVHDVLRSRGAVAVCSELGGWCFLTPDVRVDG